jgi:hypothetical protein
LAQEKKKDEATKDSKKGKGERITLSVDGVECPGCAKVLSTTLKECGLEVAGNLAPNKDGPSQIAATCEADCDLGACAAKVNDAKTPHREKRPPSLTIVLFSKVDDQKSQDVSAALRKINGVDGGASKTDAKAGEIHVRLKGGQKVTADQIIKALSDAGIQAQATKARA